MNSYIRVLLTTGLVTLSQGISAVDISHGKTLQQQHCMACHDDGIYTRNERRVTTLAGLHRQVKRCELTLGLQWFDEDINDVAAYLNESFYNLK